jgi:hypothetical protein
MRPPARPVTRGFRKVLALPRANRESRGGHGRARGADRTLSEISQLSPILRPSSRGIPVHAGLVRPSYHEAVPVTASRMLSSTPETRVALCGHPYPWSSSRRLNRAGARHDVDLGREGQDIPIAPRVSAGRALRMPRSHSITNEPPRLPSRGFV